MDKTFIDGWTDVACDWLSWLGSPMLYDGGLCVNRTAAEHAETLKHQCKPGLQVTDGVFK